MERHDRVCFEIAGLTMIFHGVALDRHPRLVEPVLKALGPGSPAPARPSLDLPFHGQLESMGFEQWHLMEAQGLELALPQWGGLEYKHRNGRTKLRSSRVSTEPHDPQRPPQLISLHSGL
jgi:hypothetical protein